MMSALVRLISVPCFGTQVYKGHVGKVRSVSFSPSGQWAISGGDDKTARLWEVITGRCIRTFAMDDAVVSVAWNPNKVWPQLGPIERMRALSRIHRFANVR
jgi:ribosome biogenesis protein ERB1